MKFESYKAFFAYTLAILAGVLNKLAVPFVVLCLLMAADYCTGLVKSKHTGTISSRTGVKGIIKKLCYMGAVIAAAGVDYTIYYVSGSLGEDVKFKCIFVLLVTFWLIINECISILENLTAIGVPLPAFLLAVAKKLKSNVETKGEKEDKIEKQ